MSTTNVTPIATDGNCIPAAAMTAADADNRSVTTTTKLAEFLGVRLRRATVAHQLFYWMSRAGDGRSRSSLGAGRVAKADQELADECLVTVYIVRQTRQLLESLGVVETTVRKWNGSPTLHYRLNEDVLCALWRLFDEAPEAWASVRDELVEADADAATAAQAVRSFEVVRRLFRGRKVVLSKSQKPITETTSEITNTPPVRTRGEEPEDSQGELELGEGGDFVVEEQGAEVVELTVPRHRPAAHEARREDVEEPEPDEPDSTGPDINDRYWREHDVEQVEAADRMDPVHEFAPEFKRRTGWTLRANDQREGPIIRGIVLYHRREELLELMDKAGRPSIRYPWTWFCSELERRAKSRRTTSAQDYKRKQKALQRRDQREKAEAEAALAEFIENTKGDV
jgi:hypothetical protein